MDSRSQVDIIFETGGATGRLLRDINWSVTPLGAPERWPQSLLSALSICLNTQYAICVYWGPEHIMLYNDFYAPIAGERHPWALGRPITEVWSEIWPDISSIFAEALQRGEGSSVEDHLLPMTRNGYLEECFFSYTISPIRGENGAVVGIFNVAVETTRRVLAARRATLLKRLAELSATAKSADEACCSAAQILEGAPDIPFAMIYLIEEESKHRARLAATAGLGPAEQGGCSKIDSAMAQWFWPLDLVLGSARQVTVDDLWRRCGASLPHGASGQPVSHAVLAPIFVGTRGESMCGVLVAGISPRLALDDRYRAFVDDVAGGIGAAIAAARAHAEDRRLATELYARSLIEALPVTVYVTDRSGRIMLYNQAAAALWGREPPPGDAAWIHSWKLFHPDGTPLPSTESPMALALRDGGSEQSGELLAEQPNGSRLYLIGYSTPRFDDNGTLVGAINVLVDVTERRRIEQEIQEARKLDALGQLAGGVAHDFNNLLGAILGFAQFIAEDSCVDDPNHRLAGRILVAARRGKALVEQILTFVRRSEPARSRFQLADVVIETQDLVRVGIGPTTRIVLDLDGCDAAVDADRDQLGQVLLNLCLNANDSLEGRAGAITIAVRTEPLDNAPLDRLVRGSISNPTHSIETRVDPSGDVWAVSGRFDAAQSHAILEVSDTGVGMDAALLKRAFTPYFTTKPKGRGTGLGLAVVHRIVLSHGGAVIVQTRQGKGTRVTIVLPRSASVDQNLSKVESLSVQAPLGKRLLVIDDDPDFGDMLALALERRGYRVTACANPVTALERFRRQPDAWDAVISDESMPDLRGLDLLREVRALRPDVPRILCYGYSEQLLDETTTRIEANAVFRKPLDIDALLAALTQLVAVPNSAGHARKRARLRG
jgi:PAS domain S-box-containing protein